MGTGISQFQTDQFGGGGAPDDAEYLVLTPSAVLTQERDFTPTSPGLAAVDGGAGGAYTLSNTLSTGLAGGQTVIGGTAASETLSLQSTTNAARGNVISLDPFVTTSSATRAGLRVGSVAGDPGTLANGDIWYNSTTNKFRARENGASVDLIGAGGGGGWTDAGTVVHLATDTDDVSIGISPGSIAKLGVVGDTVGEVTTIIRAVAAQTANILSLQTSTPTTVFAVNPRGDVSLTPIAATSGVPVHFLMDGAAHTNLTASAEAIDVDIDLARTVQHATGAVVTQRAMLVRAPTYSFVAGSTITTAATLAISGAPIAGANATITNSFALSVEGGLTNLVGNVGIGTATAAGSGNALNVVNTVGGTVAIHVIGAAAQSVDIAQIVTNSSNGFFVGSNGAYQLTSDPLGAVTTAQFIFTGATRTAATAGTESLSVHFNLSATVEHATGAIATQRAVLIESPTYSFVGASTITTTATVAIDGSPKTGANATFTSAMALWVGGAGAGASNTYFGSSPSLGGGIGVIGIANAAVVPTTNPAAGGLLYSNAGAGTWRGSGGTVTAFGPAGPHCGKCGYDAWTVACYNDQWKSWHYVCGNCSAIYKGGPTDVLALLTEEQRGEMLHPNMRWQDVARVLRVA